MSKPLFSSQQIAQYYDVTRDHYNFFWNLKKSRSLHYGYWDNQTKNFTEALARINEVMSEMVGITDGQHILDTGCGEGGSVAWLVSNFDVTATGITLSTLQAQSGNQYFKKQQLHKAQLEVRDYLNTGFTENSFDVVWAIESVCHAENKAAYLKEAYRILKPGGKLILADFFLNKKLDSKEQKVINNWAHAWSVPGFDEVVDFNQKTRQANFSKTTAKDITPQVKKSVTRLYRLFYLGLPFSLLYNLFHPKATAASKRNVYSAYWQRVAFQQKLWNYSIVVCEK